MKRPTEINPICVERLKTLLSKHHTTQTQLSQMTDISMNTLSKIVNGKSPLTPYVADKIVKCFPGTRYEWLMGSDRFETDAEKQLFPAIDSMVRKRDAERAVMAFLKVYGITIEANSAVEMTTGEFFDLPKDKVKNAVKNALTTLNSDHAFVVKDRRGNILKYISDAERKRFIEDIYDFVDMKFDKLTKVGNSYG